MKPSKKSGVPHEPENVEAADVEGMTPEERVDSIEGEEGNGGAYGRPRPSGDDEKADRSRERG